MDYLVKKQRMDSILSTRIRNSSFPTFSSLPKSPMATAYRAPPYLSCAAPMAKQRTPSLPCFREESHLHNPFLCLSRSSNGWSIRNRSSFTSVSVSKRRRRRRQASGNEKFLCVLSDGPEAVTACAWNELVVCSDIPVLVVFWASWCGPCRMVHRVIDEIAREYDGRIKCYKLDTDDYPQTATSHSIERIPTVLLFKDGEKFESITGTLPKSIYVKAIERSLSS
ncbi:thioredoxin M3, chloroplastic-like [Typha latifolia]|uniref:thioredoxin M3, chloroplastic-like n=1 Tax=Typha latifolia TaxID=4733 RepID=UPI003C2ECB48